MKFTSFRTRRTAFFSSVGLVSMLVGAGSAAVAEDWPSFRGAAGNAVAIESSVPMSWSSEANLRWKTEMPGPGASSPIVVGGKVFVTCYSGYGLKQESPGEIENLVRHLVCVDLATGEKMWQQDVPVTLPEDPYSGIGVTAHGYASHTPVSDGTNVYAFFGKSGVHAFTLDGKKLWDAQVGKESDPARWGSSSSPVVHENLVIVTASAESQAVVAFDKQSGKEVWRQEAKGLDGMWGTPSLVDVGNGKTELVMCVAKELWGMDPATGDLLWFADATGSQQAYSSLVLDGKRVYAFTGRGGGSIALDAGGRGDVSESKTVWTGRDNASFASPVGYNGKLYVVARNVMTVVDAKTGERLEQIRLRGARQTGGRFGSLDYASPIVVGDKLFYMNGSGQVYVFKLGEKTEQIALNQMVGEANDEDRELFWGTPAVSENAMVIRSSKSLYCIADKGETVQQDASLLAQADSPAIGNAGGSPARGGGGPGGAGRGGRGGGPGAAGRGGPGGPGGAGGGRRFDPMSMFNQMDGDSDGKVTAKELEGNRMADRLMTLDKDGDKAISKDEFTGGIANLFRGGGGGRGGRGSGGGYGGRGQDDRPDRPQRPGGLGE